MIGEIRVGDRVMMVSHDTNGDVGYGLPDEHEQTDPPSAEELLVVVQAVLPCLTAEQLLAVGRDILRLIVGSVEVDASMWTGVWLRLMKPAILSEKVTESRVRDDLASGK